MPDIVTRSKGDLTKALLSEIEILRRLPDIQKKRMNLDTLDPTDENNCFLAQIFGQRRAESHREKVGIVYAKDYKFSMTPLEVWSARKWKRGGAKNIDEVQSVFMYILNPKKPNVTFKL